MNKAFWLIFTFSFFLFSCKTSKETARGAGKSISADSLFVHLENDNKAYDWFSAKARVHYEDGNFSKSFNAAIRMRKDSVIWMSLTTMLGIEAARLLIKGDSVFLLDRLNKKYQSGTLSYLEYYVPFKLNIAMMQKILVGEAMFLPTEKSRLKFEKNNYQLISEDKNKRHTLTINGHNLAISTEHLIDRQNDRSISLIFADYQYEENRLFSFGREITVKGSDAIALSMKFSKVKWNEPQTFPFHVSDKYE